jgi:hypothetical protein
MSKAEVVAGIRSALPALKGCYEKLLEREPAASGRLIVRFTIVARDGAGRISEATVLPQAEDDGVPEISAPLTQLCFLNALAAAPFAAPADGPVHVTYPFTFTAAASPSR